jgi:hypothetical protein
VAAAVLAGGCSTYRAATPEVLPAGARVRVALTQEGSSALAPVLGTSVSGVEGVWGVAAGDSVVVRVDRLLTVPGVSIAWTGAAVGLRRGGIRSVERSTISRGRTAVVVGAAALLAAAAVELFRRGGKGQGGGGDGGPTPF